MSTFYYLIIYNIGIICLVYRKKREEFYFNLLLWTATSFAIYLGINEISHGSLFLLFPLFSFSIFFLSYHYKKVMLFNGFLFNCSLLFFSRYLIFYFNKTSDWLVFFILAMLLILLFLVLLLGSWSLIVFLYWNARLMIKREGLSLSNLLILTLALLLTFFSVYNYYFIKILPEWIVVLSGFVPFSLAYFSFIFLNFLVISLIYQLNRPEYDQDFIIVLGAGLLNGETVSPLLAQRIHKALDFYDQQKLKTRHPLKIIFSGGQGLDEKISEATAMRNYALEHGYPIEDLLIEDQSTTTFENMKLSKEIIIKKIPLNAKVIFVSNNYHIFRAGIYADKNLLKADGLGSKTALYYLPTAFLREFIAIIALQKKRHFILLGISALFFIFLAFLTIIIQ